MNRANFSPLFASMYCGLCNIARKHGYALAIHGTMNIDFDLVAIPWTDEAVEPIVFINEMLNLMNLCGVENHGLYNLEPTIKPHGRLAWLIILGNGATIDLSVMPRKT